MRILICGGCGFLGRHVTTLLSDVAVVYDNLTYATEYFNPVTFVRGDVVDYERLQPELDRADCVVWLAAIVGDAACIVNPARAIAINQGAVKYLARHYDGPILFTSTCSTYGVSDEVASEDSPLAPVSLYAETKIKAEEYLSGKRACILRLGTLHGTSTRMRFDLVVNAMTLNAVRDGVIQVYGGRQYRPLLSVRDAADTISHLARTFSDDDVGVFNLASENLTIHEVALGVQSVTDAGIQVVESEHEDKRNYRVSMRREFSSLNRTIVDSTRDVAALLRSGRLRDISPGRYSNLALLRRNDSGNT